jgi:hypothetical protein
MANHTNVSKTSIWTLKDYVRELHRQEAIDRRLGFSGELALVNCWEEAAHTAPARVLRRAIDDNNPQAVILQVSHLLFRLGIVLPEELEDKVFQPFPKTVGAKKKKATADARDAFLELSRTLGRAPTGTELARRMIGRQAFERLSQTRRHNEATKWLTAAKRRLPATQRASN